MFTNKAYSLSTQEGDSILDAEGREDLWAALQEGHSLALAIAVDSALGNDFEELAAGLIREQTGLTLTVHNLAATP